MQPGYSKFNVSAVHRSMVQQDLCSLLQGLEDLLQALSPTLAFPEHWVHLQRLEQHIL